MLETLQGAIERESVVNGVSHRRMKILHGAQQSFTVCIPTCQGHQLQEHAQRVLGGWQDAQAKVQGEEEPSYNQTFMSGLGESVAFVRTF